MPAPTLAVNPKVPKPALGEPGDSSKKPADDDHHLCGNANCSKSKIAGLVVACILVAVLLAIVIGVVVKKSWDRHRHTKYKKLTILLMGCTVNVMYIAINVYFCWCHTPCGCLPMPFVLFSVKIFMYVILCVDMELQHFFFYCYKTLIFKAFMRQVDT